MNNKLTFIGNDLLDALSQQAENVVYYCTVDNVSANQKVHELRRSFKRLRSLLRLLYGLPDGNAMVLATDIRNFGKLLSPLRESAVNCDVFDRLVSANNLLPENKIRLLKDQLSGHNQMLLGKEFIDNNLQNTIRNYFDGFNNLLTANDIDKDDRFHICQKIVRSYKKSYNLCHSLPFEPHPEELHEVRKKLKRLLYQLAFIRFLHPRYFRAKTFLLNKFTDQLGDDHDLHVFIEDLMAEKFEIEDEALDILNDTVEKLLEQNLVTLQPRLEQFFSTTPKEFSLTLERFFRLKTR